MANFENFLAVKYIKSSKGKERLISFSSLMSILGIVIGVAALIIVMGVMNGFDKELEKKILDITPHVFIKNSYGVFDYNNSLINKLKKEKGVKSVYPLLTTQGMISCCNFSSGIVINGINPDKNNPAEKYIIKGKLTNNGVIVGYELAKILGIGIGDTIRIILPFGKTTPFGFAPLSFKVPVSGIFKCGMYDYDSTFVYIPLDILWSKTNLKGKINTIAIELKDPFKAEDFSNRIAMQLPINFYTSNWIQINSNFFTALKLEKAAMFIILLLVVLVAAFNITSSLTMMVMEKTKEIAILRSLGATEKNIKNIFIKQAAIIGIIGVLIGDVLGITLSLLLKKYHFIELPKSVYYITTIPVDINIFYISLISILSFILTLISGIYPASKASKLDIVQVLRS